MDLPKKTDFLINNRYSCSIEHRSKCIPIMSISYDAKTVSLIKIKLPGDDLWQPEQQLAQLELLLVGQAHAHLLLLTNPAEITLCIWDILVYMFCTLVFCFKRKNLS